MTPAPAAKRNRRGFWLALVLLLAVLLEMAAGFAREVPAERFETLYITPSRHMNAAGNARLADLVAARVREVMVVKAAP